VYFNVNCNILKQICCALVGPIKDWIMDTAGRTEFNVGLVYMVKGLRLQEMQEMSPATRLLPTFQEMLSKLQLFPHSQHTCRPLLPFFIQSLYCLLHLYQKMLNLYHKILNLYQKMLNLYQKILNLYQKILNLYQKMLNLYQKMLNLYQKILNLYRRC
jgi:tetratricopeptide (TPR) repeat protein